MNLPITKNLAAITLVSVLAVLIGSLALILSYLNLDKKNLDATDSVQVISMSVAELYQKGPAPTQAQIDDNIRVLIQASVINSGLDAQNRPVDPYGTPFRVRHTLDGKLHTVTATSAGPDRQFDTPDDIHHDVTWETPTPEKR